MLGGATFIGSCALLEAEGGEVTSGPGTTQLFVVGNEGTSLWLASLDMNVVWYLLGLMKRGPGSAWPRVRLSWRWLSPPLIVDITRLKATSRFFPVTHHLIVQIGIKVLKTDSLL